MPELQVSVQGHLGEGIGVRWDGHLVTPLPRALTGSDPGRVASYSGLQVKFKIIMNTLLLVLGSIQNKVCQVSGILVGFRFCNK